MNAKRDWWLAALCAVAVLIEIGVRKDLAHPLLSGALGLSIAGALVLRRRRPLASTVFAFGLATGATLAEIAYELPAFGPHSAAFVLVLPYSLARWGSRRDVTIGVLVMACAYAAALAHHEMKDLADAVGGAVVLLFPGAIGVTMRSQRRAQLRDVEHAKLRERTRLARELHDSVAHHVTAIAIQAQAARAVLSTRPDAAAQSLASIEDESRRTLAELRSLVGALRDDDVLALVPAGRIADIPTLASQVGEMPKVTVALTGDFAGISPAVERAVYRLAQESLTNTVKHAKNATTMTIAIDAQAHHIHLCARDDGASSTSRSGTGFNARPNALSHDPSHSGFGLIGMAERAALLGGTFSAGPVDHGWVVEAVLPRTGGGA